MPISLVTLSDFMISALGLVWVSTLNFSSEACAFRDKSCCLFMTAGNSWTVPVQSSRCLGGGGVSLFFFLFLQEDYYRAILSVSFDPHQKVI